jgi:hypothetical protein
MCGIYEVRHWDGLRCYDIQCVRERVYTFKHFYWEYKTRWEIIVFTTWKPPFSGSLNFDLGSLCYSHYAHPAFKCPESVVTHLSCDSFHKRTRFSFQILQTSDLCAVHPVLCVLPKVEIYGHWIRGSWRHVTAPPLPIHLAGNVASRNCLTVKPQCGCASSCWKVQIHWNGEKWEGNNPFWVAVSCDENYILLALYFLSKNV